LSKLRASKSGARSCAYIVEVATVAQQDSRSTANGSGSRRIRERTDPAPRSDISSSRITRKGRSSARGRPLEIDLVPSSIARPSEAQMARLSAIWQGQSRCPARYTSRTSAGNRHKANLIRRSRRSSVHRPWCSGKKANVEQTELNSNGPDHVFGQRIAGSHNSRLESRWTQFGPHLLCASGPDQAYSREVEQQFTNFHRRFPRRQAVEEQRKRIPLKLISPTAVCTSIPARFILADREVNPRLDDTDRGVFPIPTIFFVQADMARSRIGEDAE